MGVFMQETLPIGMEVVEFLWATVAWGGGTDISWITPPDITPWATIFTWTIPGKFYVGDSVTFSYRVKFDNGEETWWSGAQICNEVESWGETYEDPDTVQANNLTGVCLTLLWCSPTQDCAAEVYGQNFEYAQTPSVSGTDFDLTLSTECQIEATCDMATGFVMNSTVTYKTCDMSVSVNAWWTIATVFFWESPSNILPPTSVNVPCAWNCSLAVQNLLASTFNGWVYHYVDPTSLWAIWGPGIYDLTYDCREGQYLLECALPKDSCGEVRARWYVGWAAWTDLGSVVEPAEWSTDDGVASSAPIWSGQCDTCNSDGWVCGDNILDPREDCDGTENCVACACDNGTVPCNWFCVDAGAWACLEVCGDGIKEPTEWCDDGNTLDGDGCSSDCEIEWGASNLGVVKTASQIAWSTWYFFIDITWAPGEIGSVIDVLTQNPNGDVIYSYEVISLTNVSSTCSGAWGVWFTCTDLDLIDDTIGWAMSIQVTMQLLQWGDDDVCDRVTVSQLTPQWATLYAYSEEVCLELYNLEIQKSYLTQYDSTYWNVAINTYPSAYLMSGNINDGDWVVYVVTWINSGPQDAWNPVITDTLQPGLELVDILSVTSPLPYTFTSLTENWFVTELDGKFLVGQTVTFVFLARFDEQAPGYAWSPICNEADIIGENPSNEETPPNNQTWVCLNVLPCSLRNDCAAEIYGIDFNLENVGNTVTVDGFCQVEGTCGSTEYLTSNVVTLTYGTCNGTYVVNEPMGLDDYECVWFSNTLWCMMMECMKYSASSTKCDRCLVYW
jgi:uncharacterized repeat protein (TIGR01451 family)